MMTLRSRWTLLLAAALAVLPTAARAQGTGRLELTVVDSAGAPIEGVSVEVAGIGNRVLTNGRGVARVNAVPVGSRVVAASRIGYAPARIAVDFTAGEATTSTVTLLPSAVALEGISGTGGRLNRTLSATGFYNRQRRGLGSYLTADQIEVIRPLQAIDLMRRMQGFYVTLDGRGYLVMKTTRGTAGLRQCGAPLVYLDGMQVPARVDEREDMLAFIVPENLAGMEAYAGPSTIPPQYNPTGSACGVVLMWTKTGPD